MSQELKLSYTIEIIASVSILLPIIVGSSINFRKNKELSFTIVFYYCVIYLLLEVIAWYYVLNHKQNHFLHNILSYIDIIFSGAYFYQIIKSASMKKILIVITIVNTLLVLWSHWATGRDFNHIDSFASSLGSLCKIIMCILFFYQLLVDMTVLNILKYPHFWIVSGILLYFSGAFFTFTFVEYITFSKDVSIIQYISISTFLLFVQRIFLAIGLWFSKTPQQSNPSSK